MRLTGKPPRVQISHTLSLSSHHLFGSRLETPHVSFPPRKRNFHFVRSKKAAHAPPPVQSPPAVTVINVTFPCVVQENASPRGNPDFPIISSYPPSARCHPSHIPRKANIWLGLSVANRVQSPARPLSQLAVHTDIRFIIKPGYIINPLTRQRIS